MAEQAKLWGTELETLRGQAMTEINNIKAAHAREMVQVRAEFIEDREYEEEVSAEDELAAEEDRGYVEVQQPVPVTAKVEYEMVQPGAQFKRPEPLRRKVPKPVSQRRARDRPPRGRVAASEVGPQGLTAQDVAAIVRAEMESYRNPVQSVNEQPTGVSAQQNPLERYTPSFRR